MNWFFIDVLLYLKEASKEEKEFGQLIFFLFSSYIYLFYVEDYNELLCQVVQGKFKNMLIWEGHLISGRILEISGKALSVKDSSVYPFYRKECVYSY